MKGATSIFACLFVQLFLCHSNCSEPPKEPYAVRVTEAEDGELYSWLRHGSLFYRFPPKENVREALYCGANGPLIKISDLPSFSWMMREELQDQVSVTAFVKGPLPRVFLLFFDSRGDIIDKEFVHYMGLIPAEGWKLNDTPAEAVIRSLQILEKYEYTGPTIENQRWQVDFYALLGNGRVEKYRLGGDMQPFAVTHFTHESAEKEGTVAVPRSPGDMKHH